MRNRDAVCEDVAVRTFMLACSHGLNLMGFEIKHGKDHLPDEDDIYGVNDAEERDAFNAFFGAKPIEARLRRRRTILVLTAVALIIALGFFLAIDLLFVLHR